MPSLSATASIAFCGSQPPACSCARHNNGITAEACRPGGYLWISRTAQVSVSAVQANSGGWTSTGGRGRLDVLLLEFAFCRRTHIALCPAALGPSRHGAVLI